MIWPIPMLLCAFGFAYGNANFVFILIFFLPLLISFIPISWISGALSIENEARLGQLLLPLASSKTVKDEPKLTQLEDILRRLVESNHDLKANPLHLLISKSTEINAFALPGGTIVFNEGLLNNLESADELAGVLGHEVAHVALRHHVKALAGKSGFILGVGAIGVMISPYLAIMIAKGGQLVSLRYSRNDELEADRQAFQYLRNAGIPTQDMTTFFAP